MCGVLKDKQSPGLCKLNLKGPYFTLFWDLIWGIGTPKMIYQWFKVEKTACPLFCLSLVFQTEQAVFACLIHYSWAPALIGWLHFEWHATRPFPGLILAHWLSLVNTAESHVVMFGYIYRRPATYSQSVTTGCFLTVSYTLLMFVQVLEGQSANVGVNPEFQYGFWVRIYIPELQIQDEVTSTAGVFNQGSAAPWWSVTALQGVREICFDISTHFQITLEYCEKYLK